MGSAGWGPADAPSPFKKGREVYSPNNYQEIVQDAVAALLRGMATGQRLLEVSTSAKQFGCLRA